MKAMAAQASVFPTGVGMNRTTDALDKMIAGVPHGRGDEPHCTPLTNSSPIVFPTGVGMNRPRG